LEKKKSRYGPDRMMVGDMLPILPPLDPLRNPDALSAYRQSTVLDKPIFLR